MCGELAARRLPAPGIAGSSPRVRGTRRRRPARRAGPRFIPACAGNSAAAALIRIWIAVHPRVCGELAGGARRGHRRGRFIPACAGNSASASAASAAAWRAAVHPRVCGELDARARFAFGFGGSSPRVRGTRLAPAPPARGGRFIPACAGNSRPPTPPANAAPVHPRVCGELSPANAARQRRPGSSPRVRGTPLRDQAVAALGRFIPACAGNSQRPELPCHRAAVHPRVCGELAGFAPRCAYRARFIPACAGNSRRRRATRRAPPVHPRVCGELAASSSSWRIAGGSSPRVRGTLPGAGSRRAARRFIPACAGNSPPAAAARAPPSVHPRVCGELKPPPATTDSSGGSSPRVRGTLPVSQICSCIGTVHPRVCGELTEEGRALSLADGSSPRVRGTRGRAAVDTHGHRFIPACAGNSRK